MDIIFFLLFCLSIIFLFLGLLKPKLAFMPSRKRVLITYPFIMVVSFIIFVATVTPPMNEVTSTDVNEETGEEVSDNNGGTVIFKEDSETYINDVITAEESTEKGMGETTETQTSDLKVEKPDRSDNNQLQAEDDVNGHKGDSSYTSEMLQKDLDEFAKEYDGIVNISPAYPDGWDVVIVTVHDDWYYLLEHEKERVAEDIGLLVEGYVITSGLEPYATVKLVDTAGKDVAVPKLFGDGYDIKR